jgi:SAM-dependent methyltransferase
VNGHHNDSATAIAGVYNGAIASAAIAAAWEVGALKLLRDHGSIDLDEFSAARDFDSVATRAMFTALAAAEIVVIDGNKITAGENLAEAYRTKGFFYWLVRGSSNVFIRMPELLHSSERGDGSYSRDAAAIAMACRDINHNFFDPVFQAAIAGIEYSSVADLGCGSGERLFQLLRYRDDAKGLGIDVAHAALTVAEAAAIDAGLSERVAFLNDDVSKLEPRLEFDCVDLITCFLMGHDFWPLENCVESLRRIRIAFPHAKRLLLGDTARTTQYRQQDFPIFTLGFEVGHDLMGTYIPTLCEWDVAIERSGWTCIKTHLVHTPADSVIFELEPR